MYWFMIFRIELVVKENGVLIQKLLIKYMANLIAVNFMKLKYVKNKYDKISIQS